MPACILMHTNIQLELFNFPPFQSLFTAVLLFQDQVVDIVGLYTGARQYTSTSYLCEINWIFID